MQRIGDDLLLCILDTFLPHQRQELLACAAVSRRFRTVSRIHPAYYFSCMLDVSYLDRPLFVQVADQFSMRLGAMIEAAVPVKVTVDVSERFNWSLRHFMAEPGFQNGAEEMAQIDSTPEVTDHDFTKSWETVIDAITRALKAGEGG
jgi:hypothetical protein